MVMKGNAAYFGSFRINCPSLFYMEKKDIERIERNINKLIKNVDTINNILVFFVFYMIIILGIILGLLIDLSK